MILYSMVQNYLGAPVILILWISQSSQQKTKTKSFSFTPPPLGSPFPLASPSPLSHLLNVSGNKNAFYMWRLNFKSTHYTTKSQNLKYFRDLSDETNCDIPLFTCCDGGSIPGAEQCNGFRNCRDGSDEFYCSQGRRTNKLSLVRSYQIYKEIESMPKTLIIYPLIFANLMV